jgi:hypothetical protein
MQKFASDNAPQADLHSARAADCGVSERRNRGTIGNVGILRIAVLRWAQGTSYKNSVRLSGPNGRRS